MAVCGDKADAEMAVLPNSHSRLFSSSPAPTIAAGPAICEPLFAHLHIFYLVITGLGGESRGPAEGLAEAAGRPVIT